MPELPEVHTVQQYFNATSLHQRIDRVEVRDGQVIRNVSPAEFIERLTGRAFTGSYRRGKYLFAGLDNGHHLQLHLGMSGDLQYFLSPEDAPRFTRFLFQFDSGYHLAFDCPRKLARILYLEDLEQYIRDKGLGEDAQRLSEADFLALMEGKQTTLKGFLLNQNNLAGVGNLYADEICYQARVHPASVVSRLEEPLRRTIYQKMQEILAFAVEQQAHYKSYPDNWLWQWRQEGHPCPEGHGTVVEKMTVAGRTTYFCPGRQRRW